MVSIMPGRTDCRVPRHAGCMGRGGLVSVRMTFAVSTAAAHMCPETMVRQVVATRQTVPTWRALMLTRQQSVQAVPEQADHGKDRRQQQ